MDPFQTRLLAVLQTLQLALDAAQIDHLLRHYRLLLQWNRKMNLTSIRSPEAIAERHFGEALFLAKALPPGHGTLADVGSGAGFPGFPVAVARPDLRVTLIESNGKKAVFLKELARPLANIHVHQGRFENLEDTFDWATIRAVGPLKLWPQLPKRCRAMALLVAKSQLQTLQLLPGIRWQPPLSLPWGGGRYLLVGEV